MPACGRGRSRAQACPSVGEVMARNPGRDLALGGVGALDREERLGNGVSAGLWDW